MQCMPFKLIKKRIKTHKRHSIYNYLFNHKKLNKYPVITLGLPFFFYEIHFLKLASQNFLDFFFCVLIPIFYVALPQTLDSIKLEFFSEST